MSIVNKVALTVEEMYNCNAIATEVVKLWHYDFLKKISGHFTPKNSRY